jgi:hypothetical protein
MIAFAFEDMKVLTAKCGKLGLIRGLECVTRFLILPKEAHPTPSDDERGKTVLDCVFWKERDTEEIARK